MTHLAWITAIVLLGLLPACGSRSMYEMMRLHQDQRCLALQGSDRNACLQRNQMSYDEYQRQLKERDQER
jgi:hypothetical protein